MSIIPINDITTPFNARLRTFVNNGKRYLNGDDVCNILKFNQEMLLIII